MIEVLRREHKEEIMREVGRIRSTESKSMAEAIDGIMKKNEKKIRKIREEVEGTWKEKAEDAHDRNKQDENMYKGKLRKLEKEVQVAMEALRAEENEGKQKDNEFERELGRIKEELERTGKNLRTMEEEKGEVERKFEQSKRQVMEGVEAKEEKEKVAAELGLQKLEYKTLKEQVEGLKDKVKEREKEKNEMENESNAAEEVRMRLRIAKSKAMRRRFFFS